MNIIFDCAIIGGGIAAYSCGLLLNVYNIKAIIFKGKYRISHQIISPELRTYPGVDYSLSVDEFYNILEQQISKCDHYLINEKIISVNFKTFPFLLISETKTIYKAKTVVIANGLCHKTLDFTNLNFDSLKVTNKIFGCLSCEHINKLIFINKKCVIIGNGDAAFEAALLLAPITTELIILVRTKLIKASPTLKAQITAFKNITILFDVIINKIDIIDNICKLYLHDNNKLITNYIICATGHIPNVDFLDHQLKLDNGAIAVEGFSTKTSIDGIFACGSVTNVCYYQTAITVGMGSMAAYDVFKTLKDSLNKIS